MSAFEKIYKEIHRMKSENACRERVNLQSLEKAKSEIEAMVKKIK